MINCLNTTRMGKERGFGSFFFFFNLENDWKESWPIVYKWIFWERLLIV